MNILKSLRCHFGQVILRQPSTPTASTILDQKTEFTDISRLANMSDLTDTSQTIGILGTLLSYLATEVTGDAVFKRLLWPQRYCNGLSRKNWWKFALFMPAGGPLHRVSIHIIEGCYRMGLFKGPDLGHMLGTAFFDDLNRSYRIRASDSPSEETGSSSQSQSTESVRNGLLVRALNLMPALSVDAFPKRPQTEEENNLLFKVRQRVMVSHLKVSLPETWPAERTITEPTTPWHWRIFAGLILSEATGIAISVLVAACWRSYFMILWLVPLFLKLASAFTAINREPLQLREKHYAQKPAFFEVLPARDDFILIEGDEASTTQFFRHYGHPVRDRNLEIAQVVIVVMLGAFFPLSLVLSMLMMPAKMQYLWLSYQIYLTIVLHVQHFAGGEHWGTTEEMICNALLDVESRQECGPAAAVTFGGCRDSAVVFQLERTSHDRFRVGKAHLELLMGGPRGQVIEKSFHATPDRNSSGEIESEDSGSIVRFATYP